MTWSLTNGLRLKRLLNGTRSGCARPVNSVGRPDIFLMTGYRAGHITTRKGFAMKLSPINQADVDRCNEVMPESVRLAVSPEGTHVFPLPPESALCDLPDGHRGPFHAWRRAMRAPVEWPNVAATEGNPMRDNGPYHTRDQVRTQFDVLTAGIPVPSDDVANGLHEMVIREALMIAGVQLTEFEAASVTWIARQCGPEEAQVLAGMIVRSWLAGRSDIESGPGDTRREQQSLR